MKQRGSSVGVEPDTSSNCSKRFYHVLVIASKIDTLMCGPYCGLTGGGAAAAVDLIRILMTNSKAARASFPKIHHCRRNFRGKTSEFDQVPTIFIIASDRNSRGVGMLLYTVYSAKGSKCAESHGRSSLLSILIKLTDRQTERSQQQLEHAEPWN